MNGEIVTEISNALTLLRIPTEDFYLLNDEEGLLVFTACLKHFVKNGDRRWWWEGFRMPSFKFKAFDYPPDHISEILPTESSVWLIVEDDREEYYPVYNVGAVSDISRVLNECFMFEYYIISKDFQWLLCETHHKHLIGIGEILRKKNQNILERDIQN